MVPSMNYSAVSGKGDPNEEEVAYQEALNVLYAIAYTIRAIRAIRATMQLMGFLNM